MLGHIAIAAMGGCFSQNPDTGAAEATYFPAESISCATNIAKSVPSRAAGTTEFEKGFTQTRFWLRQSVPTNTGDYNYYTLGIIGTSQYGSVRCCAFIAYAYTELQYFANYAGDSFRTSSTGDPFTFYKNDGTNTHHLTNYPAVHSPLTTKSLTSVKNTDALANAPFNFRLGWGDSRFSVAFYGDFMRNDAYNIRWRRLPMLCAETRSAAIFDADGKELVEY